MPDTPYRVSKPAAAGARHAAEHAVESARQAARSTANIKEGPLTDAAKSTPAQGDAHSPDIYIGGNQSDPAADVKAIRESHPDTPSFIKAGQPKTWNNKV